MKAWDVVKLVLALVVIGLIVYAAYRVYKFLKSPSQPIFNAFSDWLQSLFQAGSKEVTQATSQVEQGLAQLGSTVESSIGMGASTAASLVKQVAAQLPATVNAAASTAEQIVGQLPKVASAAQQQASSVVAGATKAATQVGSVVNQVVANLPATVEQETQQVVAAVSAPVKQAQQFITNLFHI